MSTLLRSPERQLVYDLFATAIEAVNGRHCVNNYLSKHPIKQPVAVIAIGKAASAMMLGACAQLGDAVVSALVITKTAHLDERLANDARIECIESSHPVPDESSLAAGDRLCRYLAGLPEHTECLFLLSGGTSSLVEVLAEGVTLNALIRSNQWLLCSDLAIADINCCRKQLSVIKGGGLLAFTGNRRVTVLLLSDVPDDDVAVIGSGLLFAQPPRRLPAGLPDWFPTAEAQTDKLLVAENPVQHHVIANNQQALRAAAEKGEALGYVTTLIKEPLIGDATQTGQCLADYLAQAADGLYLWGGETTVILPDNPCPGGRNQHLALSVANGLPQGSKIVMLAAGTDGSDGTTRHAGAIIDNSTTARGHSLGLDAAKYLQRLDASSYLAACDEILITGPTGTNVMDVVIALKGSCQNRIPQQEG